jgi:hypothetical protein
MVQNVGVISDKETEFDDELLAIYAKIRKGIIDKTLESLSFKNLGNLFGIGQIKASKLRDQLVKDELATSIEGGELRII